MFTLLSPEIIFEIFTIPSFHICIKCRWRVIYFLCGCFAIFCSFFGCFRGFFKGQLISEWLLDVFIWTKKERKYFCISALPLNPSLSHLAIKTHFFGNLHQLQASNMGRVRTKGVEMAARVIIEKYYTKLNFDFKTNKRIIEEIAVIHSKPLKGQLISECLFDFFKFSKKPTKNLTNFCPRI